MKSNPLKFFFTIQLVFAIVLVIHSCKNKVGDYAEKKCHNYKESKSKKTYLTRAIPGENTLQLTIMEVETNLAIREIELSKTFLRIESKTVAPRVANINTAAIDSMLNFAKTLTVSATCTNYVTGIKMEYAIGSNSLLGLYYKPVKFCRQFLASGQGVENFGIYTLPIEGPRYEYINNTFSLAASDATTSISNYTTLIKIQHTTTTTTPVPTTITPYDVTSVIFTFQELKALIDDNSGAKNLRIYNCMREISIDPSISSLKHSLIVTTDNIKLYPNETKGRRSFKGKYANLSHLCPPSCIGDLFVFRLKSEQ